jgi:hypothetical protein
MIPCHGDKLVRLEAKVRLSPAPRLPYITAKASKLVAFL